MQIFIKGEEVPGTNKEDAPSQHGDPAAEEPVKAADSETPVDPDEEEHVAGSGDSEGHDCWLLEDCGCVGLVRYHTTKVRRLKLSTSDSQKIEQE